MRMAVWPGPDAGGDFIEVVERVQQSAFVPAAVVHGAEHGAEHGTEHSRVAVPPPCISPSMPNASAGWTVFSALVDVSGWLGADPPTAAGPGRDPLGTGTGSALDRLRADDQGVRLFGQPPVGLDRAPCRACRRAVSIPAARGGGATIVVQAVPDGMLPSLSERCEEVAVRRDLTGWDATALTEHRQEDI